MTPKELRDVPLIVTGETRDLSPAAATSWRAVQMAQRIEKEEDRKTAEQARAAPQFLVRKPF